MTQYVLATANPDKASEMRAVLGALGVDVLDRPSDVGDVDETEESLEGNALLKARAIVAATGKAAIADDTGLFVDALGGRPGIHSARYAGEGATYRDNVHKLLEELAGIDESGRRARFRTVIAVAYPDGSSFVVDGVLEGVVTQGIRGDGGFGYDPIFRADEGDGRTLAELSAKEKNQMSHRARALAKLVLELAQR